MLQLKHDDNAKRTIDSVIKEGLTHRSEKVRLKYHWLDEYYRDCLRRFPFVMPPFSPEEIQNVANAIKKERKDDHA